MEDAVIDIVCHIALAIAPAAPIGGDGDAAGAGYTDGNGAGDILTIHQTAEGIPFQLNRQPDAAQIVDFNFGNVFFRTLRDGSRGQTPGLIGRGIEHQTVGRAFGKPAPGGEFRRKGGPGVLFHGNPVFYRHQIVQIQGKQIGGISVEGFGNNQPVILQGYGEVTGALLVCAQEQGLPPDLITQKLRFNGDVLRAPVFQPKQSLASGQGGKDDGIRFIFHRALLKRPFFAFRFLVPYDCIG